MPPTPVDAFWGRTREILFCVRDADPRVNSFGPKLHFREFGQILNFGTFLRLLATNPQFCAKGALLDPKSLFGAKDVEFHQKTTGFISIRDQRSTKCVFEQKEHFCAKRALLAPKCVLGAKKHFLSKFGLLEPGRCQNRVGGRGM